MKSHLFVLAVLTSIGMGCRKAQDNNNPIQFAPISDARTVLLKDLIAVRLPSPYFHFEYDNRNFVRQISFADSFWVYNVEYENNRVKKMVNLPNNQLLEYTYKNSQVAEINEFSGRTGKRVFKYRFAYNDSNQLSQVLWIRFFDDSSSHIEKKADLIYHQDGNLYALDWYHAIPRGPLIWALRTEFTGYDDKTNVHDISLLKDHYFFDSFLFLPQVKLQRNNPSKHRITSVDSDWDISYSYEYNNNLPVKRTGLVLQTRGSRDDQPIEVTNFYSYY